MNCYNFIKEEIDLMYGAEGLKLLEELKGMNPSFILERFFPCLYGIYSDSFKTDLAKEWYKEYIKYY